MKGLKIERDGDMLRLEIDMTLGEKSTTGKTMIRCNTKDLQWDEDGQYAIKLLVIERIPND
jgi:hypothetical protein